MYKHGHSMFFSCLCPLSVTTKLNLNLSRTVYWRSIFYVTRLTLDNLASIQFLSSAERQTKIGLSISCSATFEQLFRFGATFSPWSNFSDFGQLFSFLNNFLAFLRQFVTKTTHSSYNLKHRLLFCVKYLL